MTITIDKVRWSLKELEGRWFATSKKAPDGFFLPANTTNDGLRDAIRTGYSDYWLRRRAARNNLPELS